MKETKTYHTIGLMSGTSLDGVDLAYCKFNFERRWHFEMIKAETFRYPDDLKHKLKDATSLSTSEIETLDMTLGAFYAALINDFMGNDPLDFIASHGHTIFHEPQKRLTLQIGNGDVMHEKTGIPVINDFRTQDVALGGQGAPLVPIGDQFLFGQYDYCLNLGGIANISFDRQGLRRAFDIGPCNMILNALAERVGQPYDDRGNMARRGQVLHSLLQKWNSYAYYTTPPPKSLGYEWVSAHFFDDLTHSSLSIQDLFCTAVEHIADQIVNQTSMASSLFITGGGAKNNFLIERITQKATADMKICIPNEILIDYKEALIFAFLGVLRHRNEVNVLASVTGASRDSCSGNKIGF